MRYEFRTADGRACCSTDNPAHLCDACKRKVPLTASTRRAPLEAPDPYADALSKAPYIPVPDDDPEYKPYGTPPDSYLLALSAHAMRKGTGS